MNDMNRARDYGQDGYRAEDPDLEAYEYEEEDSGVRMPLFVILSLVVVASIIGVWFVAYNYGLQNGRAENARFIAANSAAERVRPEEPGGLPAPEERDVFRQMNGETADRAETVVTREEPIVELPRPSTPPADTAPARTAEAPAPRTAVPPPSQPARTAEAPNLRDTGTSAPAPTRVTPPQTQTPQPVETARTTNQDGRIIVPPPSSRLRDAGTQAAAPAARSAGAIGPQLPRPSATSGNFVVQLASLPSQGAADQTWSRVASRYSDLMGGFTKDVQPVDLGAKGVFYRLRIGYFGSRNDAASFCQTLKARGQDCLVASR